MYNSFQRKYFPPIFSLFIRCACSSLDKRVRFNYIHRVALASRGRTFIGTIPLHILFFRVISFPELWNSPRERNKQNLHNEITARPTGLSLSLTLYQQQRGSKSDDRRKTIALFETFRSARNPPLPRNKAAVVPLSISSLFRACMHTCIGPILENSIPRRGKNRASCRERHYVERGKKIQVSVPRALIYFSTSKALNIYIYIYYTREGYENFLLVMYNESDLFFVHRRWQSLVDIQGRDLFPSNTRRARTPAHICHILLLCASFPRFSFYVPLSFRNIYQTPSLFFLVTVSFSLIYV